MTPSLSEADEKMLLEQERIEKLKGPSPFTPSETPEEVAAWREAQAKRQEAAKRSTPPRPRVEIDFLEQRRRQLIEQRRAERIKAATGGRLE
jgi:hypothetical protein